MRLCLFVCQSENVMVVDDSTHYKYNDNCLVLVDGRRDWGDYHAFFSDHEKMVHHATGEGSG